MDLPTRIEPPDDSFNALRQRVALAPEPGRRCQRRSICRTPALMSRGIICMVLGFQLRDKLLTAKGHNQRNHVIIRLDFSPSGFH